MSEPKSAGTRVGWIDTLRTVSIFAIAIAHTGHLPQALFVYVTSFFVPVFFFISGLFVKDAIRTQPFIPFAKGRIRRLLVPYVTFGVINYIPWILFLGKVRGEILPTNPVLYFLVNTLYGVGGYGWLEYNLTLWFFPCLLSVEVLFFFLIRLPTRRRLILTLFFLSMADFLFFQFFSIENFRLPFGIDIAFTAIVFYGIGYLIKPYLIQDSLRFWYSPPFVCLGMAAYLIFSNLNPESDFIIGNFGRNYFYFYLAALSGILFWTQVSRLLKPNRLFEEIGKHTLIIFPLHSLLFPIFTGILVYVFKVPKDFIDHLSVLSVVYAIVAILILLPVSRFLNRYTPWLLGKASYPRFKPS